MGLLVNAPAALLLGIAVRLATRNWTRPNDRLRSVAPARSARGAQLSVALWITLASAYVVQVIGVGLLGTQFEAVSRITGVYPGAAIFYLVPKAVTDRLPELFLTFVGTVSALLVSACVLLPLSLFAVRHRAPSYRKTI